MTTPPKMLPKSRSARLAGLAISVMMFSGMNSDADWKRDVERAACSGGRSP